MTVDPNSFRAAMGCFPTGIAVVSTLNDRGAPVGVTVNSFTSLSLNPPLVLFCLDVGNDDRTAFSACGTFAVNVLSASQRDLSVRFGSRHGRKWDGLSFETGRTGLPLLPGCLATLECTLVDVVPGGDHQILIGKVESLSHDPKGQPLLFFRGAYGRMSPPAD